MTLADKIQQFMTMYNKSVQNIISNTNITASTLSRLLHGQTLKPKLKTLQELADFFNISIDEFQIEDMQQDLVDKDLWKLRQFDTKRLINNIHNLMEQHNISIAKLSELTRIAYPVIKNILHGKVLKPQIGTIKKIVSAFDIDENTLLHGNISTLETTKTVTVPIIGLSEVEEWLETKVFKYPNWIKVIISDAENNNVFALKVNKGSDFAHIFTSDQLLVFNAKAAPKQKDTIVAKYNNVVWIYEYQVINGIIQIKRCVPSSKWVSTSPRELIIYGCIEQIFFNYKLNECEL